MGTRSLIAVMKDGEYRLAQYSQWDGYPSGQGVDMLKFLRDDMDKEKFSERLDATFQPSKEQIDGYNAEIRDKKIDVNELYPSLSRDTGAGILRLVQDSAEPLPVILSIGFAANSLFCEWAWVADFDKGTFEGFRGFNSEKLADSERFAFLQKAADGSDVYRPICHMVTFPLDNLPSDEDFLKFFKDREEDEESEE